MKNLENFRKNAYLIPMNENGEIVDYGKFDKDTWKKHILSLLSMFRMTVDNISLEESKVLAEINLEDFLRQIKMNLSKNMPALCISFEGGNFCLVPFLKNAFKDNGLLLKSYCDGEQLELIIKSNYDPILFAYNLMSDYKK
jgi:hypothetical protein